MLVQAQKIISLSRRVKIRPSKSHKKLGTSNKFTSLSSTKIYLILKNKTIFYQFKSEYAFVINIIIILTTFPEPPLDPSILSKFIFGQCLLKQLPYKLQNYQTNLKFRICDQKCFLI